MHSQKARASCPCHEMARSSYILCPGQGAQAVGMGKDFNEAFPESREIYRAANDIVGFDLASICFNGPEERLNQTDVSQPAIYVTSIACHFATGLRLVAARGRYMQEAAVASPSGMVAILGADSAAVDKLCAECAQGEVL